MRRLLWQHLLVTLALCWTVFCQASPPEASVAAVPQLSVPGGTESLSIAANNTRLASSVGGAVQIWDLRTHRLLQTIQSDLVASSPGDRMRSGSPSAVALSPDGWRVVLVTSYGMQAWNLVTGATMRFKVKAGDQLLPQDVLFVADTEFVSSGLSGLTRWSVESSAPLKQSFAAACLNIIASTSDRSAVLCGGRGTAFQVVDWRTGHTSPPLALGNSAQLDRSIVYVGGLSRDRSRAFAICDEGFWNHRFGSQCLLKIWNTATGQLIVDRPLTEGALGASYDENEKHIIVVTPQGLVRFDASSGAALPDQDGYRFEAASMTATISPDGTLAAVGSGVGDILLHREGNVAWSSPFGAAAVTGGAIAFSPDGRRFVEGESHNGLRLWDLSTGSPVWPKPATVPVRKGLLDPFDFRWILYALYSADGSRILVHNSSGVVAIVDAGTGNVLHTVECATAGPQQHVVAAFLPGNRIVTGGCATTATLSSRTTLVIWDLDSGKPVNDFGDFRLEVDSLAVTADGQRLVTDGDGGIRIWSLQTGEMLSHDGTLKRHTAAGDVECGYGSLSPNGERVVCPLLIRREGAGIQIETLWDLKSRTMLRQIGEPWQVGAQMESSGLPYEQLRNWREVSQVRQLVSFSPDSTRIDLVRWYAGKALEASTWDADTGRRIADLTPEGGVSGVTFSPDGTRILAGGTGATRILDEEGDELARVAGSSAGRYIAITPAGFFSGAPPDNGLVALVQGFRTYAISQVFKQLYRPELVIESLKGDPMREHAAEAHKLNLTQILRTGDAPVIEMPHEPAREGNVVTIKARLIDQGGGIGTRVDWKVDGKLWGPVDLSPIDESQSNIVPIENRFTLTPGEEHTIEIVAYNSTGLLASEPLTMTIARDGAPPIGTPRLYLLAVGISEYVYPRLKLNLAAKDAAAMAAAFAAIGRDFLTDVKPFLVPEKEATIEGIQSAFDRLRADPDLKSNDIFVLFLAGHGTYDGARFFFIPQDFDPRNAPEGKGHTLLHDAIDQERLERWIASVQVDKRIIILDTCESAEGGGSLIRALDSYRTTAWEQLQHATGDSLLAAAGEAAFESNTLGHGLLTYSILNSFAFRQEGDEKIAVNWDQVADQAMQDVPQLSQRLFKETQEPVRRNSLGRPVILGFRRFKLDAPPLVIPTRRYVLLKDAPLITRTGTVIGGSGSLKAPMIVDLIELDPSHKSAHVSWSGGRGDGWVRADTVSEAKDGPAVH